MKAAVYFAIVSLTLTSSTYAQGTCAAEGGNPGGVGPVESLRYGGVYNAADPYGFPSAIQPTSAVGVRPAGSQARITVVDASTPLQTPANVAGPSAPAARLTVVTDDAAPASPAAKSSASESVESTNVEITPALDSSASTINDALKGLVGTWKAVARRGDGELTTVELRLDDRGWAELTVPDANGKPSTIKRRAELEGDELKLTGPDAELLLGQLIDVNSRQMVLARAGGQVTFVRP